MVSIQSVSNYFGKKLASKVLNDKYPSVDDQIEVFSYGFMAIVGALVKGILLVAIASILGVLIPSIIITLTFSSLRIIAGGYHLKTFNLCMIFSLSQFLISALIAQHTYQYWSFTNLYYLTSICILIALYIITKYIPRDTPNKPITLATEITKFKRWSFIYLLIWSLIMMFFLLLNIKIVVIASCFGLLLELFSISKLGCLIYSKIDNSHTIINISDSEQTNKI